MTRQTDYRERKDLVFGIVVYNYIKTVSPVSSGFIAAEYQMDVSPATIRNILAELEEEGYLTHPHTSAGRVPTELGYRYYVDHLMHEIHLLEEEKERIKAECQESVHELEALLHKTSEVVSDLTHYTSIISVDGDPDKVFCHGTRYVVEFPQPQDIVKIKQILQALEEKARLLQIINQDLKKKINIYIGHETSYEDIDSCSLAVVGYKTERGPSGRIAVLGPTRMNYERVVSTLDYISDLMSEIL